ncbi:oxidoreductase [Devosia pacifica]|uniref:Oxidoreductase n=1 Tax=Devosia pacifica TaxID=1335967 RepID=A0A918VP16_9HYPH|nr:Gfo/Idh/MocA family oxidoreductase [Devosia pacifica]GHA11752.1 oxidoreductase [Devosia pacifica]
MVRAIQVGLGGWGFNWSQEVIPAVSEVEIVAYVDANPEATERVQTKLGASAGMCFQSLEDADKAVDADLVIATLRTDAHYPVVKQALQLGYNVIVEKPFASTVAEAKELVALAESQQRVLMVSQNYRFYPAPIAVQQLMATQKFGPINQVSIDFRRHAPTQGYRYWDMPDPLLADMSIHHFDLMRMVLNDDPVRVSCRTWNPEGSPFAYHPTGAALIEFSSGTVVSYRASWVSSGKNTPWAGEWTMDCAEGEIWWTSRDTRAEGDRPDIVELRPLDGQPEPMKLEDMAYTDRKGTLATVARVIETGKSPARFSSGKDNLKSLALVQANILSASRNGDWVSIEEILA